MTISGKTPQKRHGLFSLAVVLLLSGGAAFILRPNNFAVGSLGLAAILASGYFVRISHVHIRSASTTNSEQMEFTPAKRPGRLMWFAGIALLLLAGVSYLLMYIDALHGGHTAWPAELFFGVGIACAAVWGFIISKFMS